jgi:exopolysaccharide biosynthesis polyprenyl glycosylphosphotransferase
VNHALSLPAARRTPLRPQALPAGHAKRLLIVGSGRRAAALIESLHDNRVGTVVACIDPRPQPQVLSEVPVKPVALDSVSLSAWLLEEAIDEVFVTLPLRSCFDECRRVQCVGRELGIPVHLDFDWVEAPQARLVRGSSTSRITCNEHPSASKAARVMKRSFDLVGASVALLLLLPLFAIVALLIKVSSPGPVLFRQARVGRHRRVFQMFKFRTMVADAEEQRIAVAALNDAKGIMFKVSRDPRVTPLGRWLRRSSIDELPQLINVLKGEMSLVGPRPIPTWVFDQADEPGFHRRFVVMPGMTGLWQVNGREQHYTLMARHDLSYVDEWSIWLDLRILLRTIPVVIRGRGAQ